MTINLPAMVHFLTYQGEKYIAPAKAGERKEEMERFKADGQKARKAFQELSQAVETALVAFRMQKVSGWMNQAQIGRPHFWCYFQHETETRVDPGFAIRLLTLKNELAISVEVSFIERGVVPETVVRQNQVLTVPIQAPLYYFVQENGESHREPGTEEIRTQLIERVQDGSVRKVLVKYDIPAITDLETEKLIEQLVAGFHLLSPYHEATKKA